MSGLSSRRPGNDCRLSCARAQYKDLLAQREDSENNCLKPAPPLSALKLQIALIL